MSALKQYHFLMQNHKVLVMKKICIIKKKWCRNSKPSDDILVKEFDDFLFIHLF